MEENLACSLDEADVGGPQPLVPAPGLAQLERRVRRELKEQGLLSDEDPPDDQVMIPLPQGSHL